MRYNCPGLGINLGGGAGMIQEGQLKVGQIATAIFAWCADELPSSKNFHTGTVLEIVERNPHCLYARIFGLENLVPFDRILPHQTRREITKNKEKIKMAKNNKPAFETKLGVDLTFEKGGISAAIFAGDCEIGQSHFTFGRIMNSTLNLVPPEDSQSERETQIAASLRKFLKKHENGNPRNGKE